MVPFVAMIEVVKSDPARLGVLSGALTLSFGGGSGGLVAQCNEN